MPTFIGFNTQNVDTVRASSLGTGVDGAATLNKPVRYGKKFRLTDSELVVRDFINALNIPQGQKPGRPEYGTSLWSFIFEPNSLDTRTQLENEIKRVASADPRLTLNSVVVYPQEHGILIEVEVEISPFNDVQQLAIFFDQEASSAYGV